MVISIEHIISDENQNLDSKLKDDYLQTSTGLFLNATSIISGTCRTNEQELEQAKRISAIDSPINSPLKGGQARSDSLQLCPPVWYEAPEAASQRRRCVQCVWKLCFLCICLPICYPCYLSRVARQFLKNSHTRKDPKHEPTKLKDGNIDIIMSQHESLRFGHSRSFSLGEEPVLEVNVIFLQSESSTELLNLIKENEDETSPKHLLSFKPQRESKSVPRDITVERDELRMREPLITNSRIQKIIKDLSDIKEEEPDNENITNSSQISSESDIFYSLDGSNCDEEEVNSYLCALNSNESFHSEILDLSPVFLLTKNAPQHDPDKHKEIEIYPVNDREYLTPSWKAKEETGEVFETSVKSCKLEMKRQKSDSNERSQSTIGSKWVALEDSSARLNISRETSLEDCGPENIDEILTGCISAADILIAVYRDDEELSRMLNHSGGVVGYVRKYWTGFFPLLLIHLTQSSACDSVSELDSCLIAGEFSFSHRLIIQDVSSDCKFLLQSIVRYYLHVYKLQCSRLALVKRGSLIKSLVNTQWKCPGLCKLQSVNPERNQVKVKKKKTFFQSVRRSLTVRRVTRRSKTNKSPPSTLTVRKTSSVVDLSLSADKS